ncbi:MAG TPA: alpha/beta fold hydrolase [Gaiellaceae bacterium]|nr:alpha/beta fold hydrolase [Gaiellaceae bacterium]
MQTRPVSFESEGLQLDGDLYLPDLPAEARLPSVIVCSGYQGLKQIQPARFARALVPLGYVCLGFDYRGFGKSEGRAGRLMPEEQVADVLAGLSFLEGVSEVDPARMGLIGWGLGGGIAVAAAALDARVATVVALNPVANGERATEFAHEPGSWERLQARIRADRTRDVSELVPPFEILPLDRDTTVYADDELFRYPGFETPVSLESADALLRFRPEDVVRNIAPRPLLLIHGAENRLNPPVESIELHRRAGEPKQLVLLENAGHTEWMYDDDPTFARVVRLVADFLEGGLARRPAA